ncbi:MAG: hypothetical protein LUO85_04330 [Methanomassiliicoccales archaeon]|nr:hypothetical protein [Methanomassiliicoccales archaeon]
MPEKESEPKGAKTKNPFDVPPGRWKVYSILTIVAAGLALVGIALGIDILAIVGLMAALFLAIGIAYSYMNEKGL